MAVLIVTQDYDPTVDPVVEYLRSAEHRVVRFDLSDFPLDMTVIYDEFVGAVKFEARGRTVDLAQLDSVWYRRPTDFYFGPDLQSHERKFATLESSMGIGGLLRSTECLWVNRPDMESIASLKPYQLHLARSLGLTTPRTLITNDPARVRSLLASGVDLIYKLLSPGLVHDEGEMPVMLFTTRMSEVEDEKLDRIALTPCLFQELVPKEVEVRLTVIGRSYFPVIINSQDDEATFLDWRGSDEMSYGQFRAIPERVLKGVELMMERLNLAYGAIDFIVRPDGEWVFLEVNAMGQFMWLEEDLNLPMSMAMGNLLIAGHKAMSRPVSVIRYEL